MSRDTCTRRDALEAIAAVAVPLMPKVGRAQANARVFRGSRPGAQRDVEGIRFCWCPPGRFEMGSPVSEVGRRADEQQVTVTLTRGFWLAKFEATQGQWRRLVGAFPAQAPSAECGEGEDFPVYWVNFAEAEAFASALASRASRSGSLPRGWQVRLPTEAQWEYACRAGTATATSFGDRLLATQANFAPGATARGDRLNRRAMAVGSFPANAWRLADMHGNLFEWCRDWYHARLPGGVDPDLYDLPGEQNGDGTYSRCRRGGAWMDGAEFCRSALRLRYEPDRRSDHIGFRVALVEVGYS